MRAHEKEIVKITDFEQAARDPEIQKRMAEDPDFRQCFEAQRNMQSLMNVSASTQIPSDIQTRIRAGALRQIRSVEPETSSNALLGKIWEWKLVWGAALLLLLAVPAFFNQGNSLTPVTEFTFESDPELPMTEVAVDAAPVQIASNNLQNAPIEVTPVRYDLP